MIFLEQEGAIFTKEEFSKIANILDRDIEIKGVGVKATIITHCRIGLGINLSVKVVDFTW